MTENGHDTKTFDCWAVVEVMGHQKYAGRVTEQAIGGCAFVRVDVPAVGKAAAFTKLLGQGSIFCITPCSEELATRVAAQCQDRPIVVYDSVPFQNALGHEDGDDDDSDY